jgi:hypothetical protein
MLLSAINNCNVSSVPEQLFSSLTLLARVFVH